MDCGERQRTERAVSEGIIEREGGRDATARASPPVPSPLVKSPPCGAGPRQPVSGREAACPLSALYNTPSRREARLQHELRAQRARGGSAR